MDEYNTKRALHRINVDYFLPLLSLFIKITALWDFFYGINVLFIQKCLSLPKVVFLIGEKGCFNISIDGCSCFGVQCRKR